MDIFLGRIFYFHFLFLQQIIFLSQSTVHFQMLKRKEKGLGMAPTNDGRELVDFDVAHAAGREAEDGHGRALPWILDVLIQRDERLITVALDAARFPAAIGKHFANLVNSAADVDGDALRKLGRLNDDPPATESILSHLWLDEAQFGLASRFLAVIGPRPWAARGRVPRLTVS